jgi:hypothetical protein
MDNEILEYHAQPTRLALRALIGEAMGLVDKTDFTNNQQVDLLRDRLSRAIGCVGSLQVLEHMKKFNP